MITAAMIVPPEVARLLANSPHMQSITVSVQRRRPVGDSLVPAVLSIDDSSEGAKLDIGFHAQCSMGVGASTRRNNVRIGCRAGSPRLAVIGLIERACMLYIEDADDSETAMNRARLPARKNAFKVEMEVRSKGVEALTALAAQVRAAWPSTVNDD